MALIDKASLLMVPSTYEAGTLYNVLPSGNRAPDSTDQNSGYDQTRADFTFDRGSNAAATRVNADGLIEKYRENLLLQSNQFDTTWVNYNTSDTSGQSGYDGTNNAWLLSNTGASGYIRQTSISASGVQTFSIYAKAGTLSYLRVTSQSGNVKFNVNLNDGTIGTTGNLVIEAKATAVANGWYRCSMAFNASTTGVYIYPATADEDVSQTSGNILIQNAQLESGLVATDYLDSGATTAKAGVLIDLPRINYDANGENGVLLLEPSRANLVQYSEYFEHSSWDTGATTADISKSPNLSPEGVANCYYVENVSGGQLGFYTTITSGASYTGSFWVRKVSGSGVVRMLNVNNSGTDFNVGTEWTRVSVTATSTSTTGRCYVQARNTGDIIEVYGAQLEAGSYVSSYIPNHGESGGVTRAADDCEATSVGDIVGVNDLSLYVEATPLTESNAGNPPIFLTITQNNGQTNICYLQMKDNGVLRFDYYVGGVQQFRITSNTNLIDFGTTFKAAVAVKDNDCILYVNGTQIGTDTSGSTTNVFNQINCGTYVTDAYNGSSVQQLTLFKERLSNAELAALTA